MREYITAKLTQLGSGISRSKGWQHLKKHHPATHRIIKSRLTLKDFSGLPLTLLIIAITANLFLLFDFTRGVINQKAFIDMDNAVAQKLFSFRSDGMAKFFFYITQLGRVEVITVVSLVSIVIAVWSKKLHFIIPILVAALGCGITMYLGKRIFKIARPTEFAYYGIDNYSFPSGHAAISVSFYGLLFYFFIRHNYSFKIRMLLISAAIAFAGLIGFSRLYLCEHFLSDVLAGYLLGALWLLLSIGILEWNEFKRMRNKL